MLQIKILCELRAQPAQIVSHCTLKFTTVLDNINLSTKGETKQQIGLIIYEALKLAFISSNWVASASMSDTSDASNSTCNEGRQKSKGAIMRKYGWNHSHWQVVSGSRTRLLLENKYLVAGGHRHSGYIKERMDGNHTSVSWSLRFIAR